MVKNRAADTAAKIPDTVLLCFDAISLILKTLEMAS
jgi:hypothetical protein